MRSVHDPPVDLIKELKLFGDSYVYKVSCYTKIYGVSRTLHALPKYILVRLLILEIDFQTSLNGAMMMLCKSKWDM